MVPVEKAQRNPPIPLMTPPKIPKNLNGNHQYPLELVDAKDEALPMCNVFQPFSQQPVAA